ncbi:preprotein translocase subunit SecD [Paramesorhizobium deserti]|uniref:Multifunctional fusion protein n=1 Tax=Paramesorhizobium deserti TaxID=1494590 RepID=A0A135HVT0_9HYPH|nr:protein translocase subunit SecDF [Paramesorhizobium deserti]KXF77271.1 preprotein translocase subunit SecD [Paramesorhizobium deserti]
MLYFSRWKSVLIWLIVGAGVLLALPNLLSQKQLAALPDWLPKRQVALGLDLAGGSRLLLQLPPEETAKTDAAIAIMKRRLAELGYDNPLVEKQGRNKIEVEVPGLYDAQLLKDILSIEGNLSISLVDESMPVDEAIAGTPPEGSRVVYSADDPPVGYLVRTDPIVSSKNIIDAGAGVVTGTPDASIKLTLDAAGTQRLAEATAANVGKPLALVIDDQVITAPVIRERITGSQHQISGAFDLQGASNLAVVLRAGALPAPVTVLEERTIGTSLGENQASTGRIAIIIAALLVAVFMVLSYGLLGLIADIALLVNVALIVAALSLIGAPLGLAGIAGIVLTIGMAVDSSILIFERIREDSRNGAPALQAISSGFSRAIGTIVDANLTTLIAALVLFILGSGAVQGFALTVTIGIVTTIFTTFTFTRLMVSEWIRAARPTRIPGRFLRLVPSRTSIPFMRLRRVTLGVSTLACAAVIALFAVFGMNYGIDFRGGTLIELQARQGDADVPDIESRLAELNIGDFKVEPLNPRSVLITVGSQEGGEDAEQTVAVKLRGELEDEYSFQRVDVVGPTVSSQLSRAGTLAIALSLLAIFAYVWLRFQWQFALGAVLATTHDVILLAGVFILFGLEFNLWSVAAILIVIGYSLNDTVVIYDRVRDNLRQNNAVSRTALVDASINQTLSRTVLTSLVTLLALIALYVFGSADMRSLALTLGIGIVVATYSSIFIAGPLLVILGMKTRSGPTSGTAQPVAKV